MSGEIRVGTASWTDPGFVADWYPRGLPSAERLPYYAARYHLVEVNSSFYAVPARTTVENWCQRTPSGFLFNVKLHRVLSRHSTPPKMLPPELRSMTEVEGANAKLNPRLEEAMLALFLDAVRPMVSSGKFGAFLLQLTPSFSPRRNRLEELDSIIRGLSPNPVAIELRNSQWVLPEQLPGTLAFFRSRAVTLVGVDAPATEHFTIMPDLDVVTQPELAYLRLHGRNAQGYLTGKTVAERFDYLYSDQELSTLAERAAKLAAQAKRTHVIYNNNASDHAPRNATAFQKLLAQQYPETQPFPNLKSSVDTPGETMQFDFTADNGDTKRSRGRR
jgi:uncharacterized protein YecE (DUF72 family)